MKVSPLAGKPVEQAQLVDVPRLITAYYSLVPDVTIPAQRVSFGTSGHRGSAFDAAFNEAHILAVSQAICLYRKGQNISGPLYLGMDTHALSVPAFASALEVLAANGVETMVDSGEGYTPTPAISRAILTYNRGRKSGLADGIVITPSHNPPSDGGFKYNPANGGPADTAITDWIQNRANDFLKNKLAGVQRVPYERALTAPTLHKHDYIATYVGDLGNVVDMEKIRSAGVRIGIDPLGGAAVNYWPAVIAKYGIKATVVRDIVDPTFRFMTADWDGKIRMDCSSPYAMVRLLAMRDRFDVAFANDTDADRHGIVTRSSGLMNPNHYLAVAISYLFPNRTRWRKDAAVGKTVVSSSMIDRVAASHERKLIETPVGFKWFVDGLIDGSVGFCGEESAGGSFLRTDGTVWTTDKDGLILGLLAAEMTAHEGRDPGTIYNDLTKKFGEPAYERIDAPATLAQKEILKNLTPEKLNARELAGEKILSTLTVAPGNQAAIGGIKVIAKSGWFAARPSGTEEVYKIYAESFKGEDHLHKIQAEAQELIAQVFKRAESGH
ncbi:MAG: phosphoglucomutase (alpha-D-glucose-1,6-bisphosphate-dependent) [Candidatus Binatus sp.]|uniref:phosphoglucomutase (alpha-D-glucose-1,6-bisphosphate-dependent) n=1 Tax=Candidatus Binatus sp. TaxID=2811406 RepID=UPI003C787CC7